MSELSEYVTHERIGQVLHKLHSIESAQSETDKKIDTLTEKVDEALTWAQRLVLLGLSLLGAMGLNYSPDKIGETLATVLKALK
jgi:p-aminobenzoyl-glutamate transporter AbgT